MFPEPLALVVAVLLDQEGSRSQPACRREAAAAVAPAANAAAVNPTVVSPAEQILSERLARGEIDEAALRS